MAEKSKKTSVIRLKELGGRDATLLEHDSLRVMVDDIGGMIPELSLINGKQQLNAHWLPWFRSNSGKPYNDTQDSTFWKAHLLYHVAGNFPCIPSFGAGHVIDGMNMPVHGWTANLPWLFHSIGADEESGAGWAFSSMESPEKTMPLSFKKIDALITGHGVHYTSIAVKNNGNKDLEICAGWHNTLGAPFLAEGCRISGAASAWATAPKESEFPPTTRLAVGAQFPSLTEAPLSAGGKIDLSHVPCPIGYTDFVTGSIDSSVALGWSSVVNPALKAVYLCFFPGPAGAGEDDIVFWFNNLWMQYGGRNYTPWALHDNGTDQTYCLGTENSVAAFSQGLEYSRQTGKLLGAPATVIIPAGKQKVIRYGSLFASYEGTSLDEGVLSLEAQAGALLGIGKKDKNRFAADPFFSVLKKIEQRIF